MQGIHTHIPETNLVHRGYIVAAILSLLFMGPLFLVPVLAIYYYYYYYYYYWESFVVILIKTNCCLNHACFMTNYDNKF